MSTLLFANNAKTTLAGAITNVATTALLASGSGALFPSPSAGQYFCLTFVDAATGLLNEIVHVTARSGDTITMVRAQEGTTALAWLSGDSAGNFWTAGSASALAQITDVQQQAGNYVADSSVVANTITLTLTPAPASYASILGAPIRGKIAVTNTSTTVNVNVNGLGNIGVVTPVGGLPAVGSLTSGAIVEFKYDGTHFQASSGLSTSSGVTFTESTISTNTALHLANSGYSYTCTAALTLILDQSTTLATNWSNTVFALGGDVTVTINAADALNGGTTGVGATIPKGFSGTLTTDANGNVYLTMSPSSVGSTSLSSSSTVDIGTSKTKAVTITGTTTITSFGSTAINGVEYSVTFSGALTLTYNGTSLILPNGTSNITTAAGDTCTVLSLGSGNFRVTNYQAKSGYATNSALSAYALNSEFTNSVGASGYQWCNGILIQWGSQAIASDPGTITFPTTFPNAVYAIQVGGFVTAAASGNNISANAAAYTTSGFSTWVQNLSSGTVSYIAIGH